MSEYPAHMIPKELDLKEHEKQKAAALRRIGDLRGILHPGTDMAADGDTHADIWQEYWDPCMLTSGKNTDGDAHAWQRCFA